MASMDPLGDTLGGLSVLGQVFTACVRGFEVWQNGKALAEDVTLLQVMLETGGQTQSLGLRVGYREECSSTPPQIPRTNSLEALDEKFPVLKLAAERQRNGSLFEFLSSLANSSISQAVRSDNLAQTVKSIEDTATLQQKWNWGWDDGKALKKLKILETLIDGLYQILPPPNDDPVAAIVLNSSLASDNIEMLEVVGHQDNTIQAALALIRSTIVKFENRSTAIQDLEIRRNWFQLTNIRNQDEKNSRATGTYQGADVLIEWKTVRSSRVQTRRVLDRRIKDVARLLRSDLKPEELRTLPCVGVVEKVDEEDIKYGLLYSLPSPSTSHSLRELVAVQKQLVLGDYFTIAKVLSKALLFLHLAGWLHKGIRSDNIVFFASTISEVLPCQPYIIGFEYSRADQQNAMTEDLDDDHEFNLYRHPDAQGLPVNPAGDGDTSTAQAATKKAPYRREYDIYSLGVILLELGVKKTVQTIFEQASLGQRYGKHSPQRFRSWLIESIGPQLGIKMGKLYRDATLLCLRGDFDLTHRTLETAFYMDVVKTLESCQV